MHGDHFAGLYPSWCGGQLYCSEVTRRLLLDKFQGFDNRLIRVLRLGETLTVPLVSAAAAGDDERANELRSFNVTAFDANHCPGAVMLLFESALGRILHTGDMRYTPRMFDDNERLARGEFDMLFLDNTFNHPGCRFPEQSVGFKAAVDVIGAHPPEVRVIIGIDGLGKEELVIGLARLFNAQVCVTPERYRWLQLCDKEMHWFTTDEHTARFHVLARRAVTKKNAYRWNKQQPTISLVCSGWSGVDELPDKVSFIGGAVDVAAAREAASDALRARDGAPFATTLGKGRQGPDSEHAPMAGVDYEVAANGALERAEADNFNDLSGSVLFDVDEDEGNSGPPPVQQQPLPLPLDAVPPFSPEHGSAGGGGQCRLLDSLVNQLPSPGALGVPSSSNPSPRTPSLAASASGTPVKSGPGGTLSFQCNPSQLLLDTVVGTGSSPAAAAAAVPSGSLNSASLRSSGAGRVDDLTVALTGSSDLRSSGGAAANVEAHCPSAGEQSRSQQPVNVSQPGQSSQQLSGRPASSSSAAVINRGKKQQRAGSAAHGASISGKLLQLLADAQGPVLLSKLSTMYKEKFKRKLKDDVPKGLVRKFLRRNEHEFVLAESGKDDVLVSARGKEVVSGEADRLVDGDSDDEDATVPIMSGSPVAAAASCPEDATDVSGPLVPPGPAAATAAVRRKRKLRLRKYLYRVPYSLHSSFPELMEFVRRARPRAIVGITDNYPSLAHFDPLMCPPDPSNRGPAAAAASAQPPVVVSKANESAFLQGEAPVTGPRSTVQSLGTSSRLYSGGRPRSGFDQADPNNLMFQLQRTGGNAPQKRRKLLQMRRRGAKFGDSTKTASAPTKSSTITLPPSPTNVSSATASVPSSSVASSHSAASNRTAMSAVVEVSSSPAAVATEAASAVGALGSRAALFDGDDDADTEEEVPSKPISRPESRPRPALVPNAIGARIRSPGPPARPDAPAPIVISESKSSLSSRSSDSDDGGLLALAQHLAEASPPMDSLQATVTNSQAVDDGDDLSDLAQATFPEPPDSNASAPDAQHLAEASKSSLSPKSSDSNDGGLLALAQHLAEASPPMDSLQATVTNSQAVDDGDDVLDLDQPTFTEPPDSNTSAPGLALSLVVDSSDITVSVSEKDLDAVRGDSESVSVLPLIN